MFIVDIAMESDLFIDDFTDKSGDVQSSYVSLPEGFTFVGLWVLVALFVGPILIRGLYETS